MEYIYRDFSFSLSKAQCAKVMQSIAISGATITSSFVISNAFPPDTVRYWTMFLKLKFRNKEQLDKFHSLGFETQKPPKISGGFPQTPEEVEY
jgi:hypothetical protein